MKQKTNYTNFDTKHVHTIAIISFFNFHQVKQMSETIQNDSSFQSKKARKERKARTTLITFKLLIQTLQFHMLLSANVKLRNNHFTRKAAKTFNIIATEVTSQTMTRTFFEVI